MMKKRRIFPLKIALGFCFLIISFTSIRWLPKSNELKNGYWRATILRPDGQQIVFNFQSKDSAGKKIIYVINGKEHLLVDSIQTRADSVFIEMPFFESSFKAKINKEGNLEGIWVKKYGERVQTLPFKAVHNTKERFEVSTSPVANISGRWVTEFKTKNNSDTIIAEFKQEGSHLSGTFLDPTGDYRFLDGVVSGDSLKLSTFDGAHAFLFTAKIDNDKKISGGKFYSGARSIQDWNAEKNAKAEVADGFGETKIKPGTGKLNFTFPDSNDGHEVSINDKKYKGKVVVIQILGSWCPNCMDETKFLSDYYNKNHQRGIEIIGLAYERTTDFKESQKALQPFKKRFDVQYPILVTGVTVSDSLRAEKTLPQLESINAFPTTIFIDKKGNIRKIDSGFAGPATGEHYTEFKTKFNKIVNALVDEN
ncbi:MAG TPA: TlpA disulfide reductase family protein, partial [Hanamia sp.]|nr:TlpA disulfide reductase family protein [Hanamia sp.]